MSNNYLLGVTGCSQGVRSETDMKLQSKWNTRENYTSPGVSSCAGARTNFDKCLQTKFGLGGNPTTSCFGGSGTQPTGSRRRAVNKRNNRRTRRGTRRGGRENFRTLAFDDTDNPYSYGIEYSPVK